MAVLGGTKAEAIAAAKDSGLTYGEGKDVTAVLYVGKPLTIDDTNGEIQVDGAKSTVGSFTAEDGNVVLGANSLTIINTSGLSADDTVFTVGERKSVKAEENSNVYLTNISKANQTFKITNGTLDDQGAKFLTKNQFFDLTVDETNKTVTAQAKKLAGTDLGSMLVTAFYTRGVSAETAGFLDTIGTKYVTAETNGLLLNAAGSRAVEEFAGAAVTSGAYNVAYDVQSEVTESISQRLSSDNQAAGFAVWADVFATDFGADEIYGKTGYSADIYGGILGGDYKFGNGLRVGAALTVGTADADSEGTVFNQSNDADFTGLNAYVSQNFGKLSVQGDLGYLHTKNELAGTYANEDIDADLWTIGADVNYVVYDGAVQVVPHAGLRYTQLDVDSLKDRNTEDMNIVELPIGVTLKGQIETNGWTLTPNADITVATQLADRDVETKVGNVKFDTDVLDSALVKTTVGLSATNGDFTFGLNYRLGCGGDDRTNHTFKLGVRYAF